MKISFGALTLSVILAIAPLPVKAQGRTITYQCSQGKTFTSEFSPNTALVKLDRNQTLTLPQILSGSGARYSDGRTTLFIKGDEAFIEVNDKVTFEQCVVVETAVAQARSGCTAVLTAKVPNSQINVRSGPGLQYSAPHYGLVGDKVVILRGNVDGFAIQRDRQGWQWVQVEFLKSKARGWIRRDLISDFRC